MDTVVPRLNNLGCGSVEWHSFRAAPGVHTVGRSSLTMKERIREAVTGMPTLDYLMKRMELGWTLAALEWEREITAEKPELKGLAEEIPYGLQVAPDCQGLVENPAEMDIIMIAVDMVVQDCPLSQIASELNRRGHTTRKGAPWTPSVLFDLLPRMIQISPRLFSTDQWTNRRQRLPRVV